MYFAAGNRGPPSLSQTDIYSNVPVQTRVLDAISPDCYYGDVEQK